MSTSGLNLIERARAFAEQTALAGPEGTLTYRDLLALSAQAASALLNGATDLSEERVAYMAPAGIHYVATSNYKTKSFHLAYHALISLVSMPRLSQLKAESTKKS